MNLLMCAPLADSRGKIRYFIGAQVDVSGLVKECTELESLQRLLELQERGEAAPDIHKPDPEKKDEFQELSEMLNGGELATVRKFGGRMHHEMDEDADGVSIGSQRPRLLLKEPSQESMHSGISGRLPGCYQHYLLVRPYPSLRILFASPSQRLPGILQSPFLNKIGGSSRVQDELTAALAEGRGVTAKVRWISKADEEGRNKWIHCTPLLGSNGRIGVWMVVIIDDDKDAGSVRRYRQAPPVPPSLPASLPASQPPSQPPSQSQSRDRGGKIRGSTNGDDVSHKSPGHTQLGRATHTSARATTYSRNNSMKGSSGEESLTSLRL